MSEWLDNDEHFATRAIHAGNDPDQWQHKDIVPPITVTSTFKQVVPGETAHGYFYNRFKTPTRTSLEDCLAAIEGAKHSLVFNAGVCSFVAVSYLLKTGDHILCTDDVYAGTPLYLVNLLTNHGINTTFVDFLDMEKVRKEIKPNTKLIWLEMPTNPLLKIVDIKKITDLVHSINPEILVVVDNTFATPYFCRPLNYGVDLVLYSLSKFMNGHSDVIMGSISTNDDKLRDKLYYIQKNMGLGPSSFDCFLVNRSLKTLKLRMEKHFANGLALAKFLEKHPKVEKIIHPGLPSHPQHELALKQCYGHSGVIGLYLKGGAEEAKKFTTSLKVAALCDSLGGVASNVVVPAITIQGYIEPGVLDRRHVITPNFIRVSVGIEDIEDIIKDFDQSLNLL